MDNYEEYYKIGQLVVRHLKGELSDDERRILSDWRGKSDANERIFVRMINEQQLLRDLPDFRSEESRERAWKNIAAAVAEKPGVFAFGYRRYIGYAAALVLSVGLGYFILRPEAGETPTVAGQTELLPGGDRALLILDDGEEIDLDKATVGEIARQGFAVISKSSEGDITYDIKTDPANNAGQVKFNTIATPNGGQYRLRLPDGTRVWLNAASSLRFPTRFDARERRVELKGEAFFEVVHLDSKKLPFRVISEKQEIEVLGTEFNVNSYSDEKSITTTLLRGKVKVNRTTSTESRSEVNSVTLMPGQKASLVLQTDQIEVAQADLAESLAWKNGKFQFNDTELETIMRQIARWYDIDVEYSGDVKKIRFRGAISRDEPASMVFRILETSGIQIKTQGRKVTVSR